MPEPAVPVPPVQITGLVQGLVLGNQGTVHQTFHQVRHEPFVPREAPATPPHWVARTALQGAALDALAAGQVVALVGMGGAGKSTLAARIAQQAGEARFPRGCFWIDLAGGAVDDALLRIALAFGHDVSGLDSREARARTARSLLAGQAVLLVLDDVWDAPDLAPFLPPPAGCAALLTTRNDAIAARCADAVLTIDRLDEPDALALLAAAAGVAADQPGLPAITRQLGGLPLALELAGKLARQQARRPGFAWSRFADELRASSQARLALGLAGSTVQLAFDASWRRGLDDAGRRAFALLGLFERGDIGCGEAAAAWGVDEPAAQALVNALLDLSLAQLADARTLRLHPLLADDAATRADALPEADRVAAHQRVADHHFDAVPGAPTGLADVLRVLRSHRHAVLAGDRDRAARVWPWFGREGSAKTAMPAELQARGLLARHVEHQRLAYRLLMQAEPWARCWAAYRLGDALLGAGKVDEADRWFDEALRLIESPAVDDDGRALGLSKFLIASGHAKAALGRLPDAEQAYRRAYETDRALARQGTVIGAHDGAMVALLQLADLQRASDDDTLRERGIALVREVFGEAMQAGRATSAWMAAQRMADSLAASRPDEAAGWLHRAWAIAEKAPAAASGEPGARYANRLADTACQLCLNGELPLNVTLAGITLAVRLARGAGSASETSRALQLLGGLLEHLFLLDLDSPLDAAWAAYQLSDDALRDVDFDRPHHGADRIAQRIRPRVAPDRRDAVAAAVAADPWGVLAAAVAPLSLAPAET